jgi:hypothetical protein
VDRAVRLVGNALRRQVARGADERVAAADVVVEETERQPGGVPFDPQRQFAQVDRQRVEIDAEDAAPDHVAHGVAELRRRRLIIAGADARQFTPQAPGGGEQKMSRSARRVADADGEQRRFARSGVASGGRQALRQHRFQRAGDQFLHQFRAGVVTAGRLAFRSGDQVEAHVG